MTEPAIQTSPTRGVSYLYMAAAFVIVVAGMRAAEPILNPLLLAVLLAVISSPAYFALLKRKFSNWLSLLIVIGVLSAAVLSLALVVRGSVSGFIARQTHYHEQWDERTRGLEKQVKSWVPTWVRNLDKQPGDGELPPPENEATPSEQAGTPALEEPTDSEPTVTAANELLPPEPGTAAGHVPPRLQLEFLPETESQDRQEVRDYMSEDFSLAIFTWVKNLALEIALSIALSIPQLLSNTFLIMLTVIFILLETGTFTRKIRQAFQHHDEAAVRAQEIITSMQNYIVIKTWVSLATGIFIAAWLWFLGVPFYALWGLLTFLFNFIPNIGSIIAAVPAILIAWLELTTLPAVATAIGFVLVNGVVGNLIEPRLMGKGLGLSPLVVFFSMVFWGWVLGPVGMLLSVPLTIAARIALDGFEDTRWIATLFGNAETT